MTKDYYTVPLVIRIAAALCAAFCALLGAVCGVGLLPLPAPSLAELLPGLLTGITLFSIFIVLGFRLLRLRSTVTEDEVRRYGPLWTTTIPRCRIAGVERRIAYNEDGGEIIYYRVSDTAGLRLFDIQNEELARDLQAGIRPPA